jgi:hypothetical protein
MASDIEKRISSIEETVEENNEMLRKIRKKEVFNFWFNIIKILIFVGVTYYGYLYIQPFLEQLLSVYASLKDTADSANEIKQNLNIGIQDFDISGLLEKITQ